MLCFCFTGDVKFVYDTDTPDESGNWGPYEMAEQGCSRTCGWVQSKTYKGPSLYYVSKRTVWVGSEKVQKYADVI